MARLQSTARTLSRALIALGFLAMAVAVGRGFMAGRLLEPGSNSLVAFVAGIFLALCGWVSRHPWLANRLDRALSWSESQTPAFLSGLARGPGFYVALGACSGVTQGLAEVAYRLYRDTAPPGRHAFWLAPLSYAVLFGLVGVMLAATARRDQVGQTHFRRGLWLLLTLGGSGLLLIALPQVHALGGALLAAGIAAQLSRVFTRHAWTIGTLVRTGRWALGVLLVLTMTWAQGGDALRARRAAAGRPAAPADARNVLLVVLDTVRAQSLSLLGYQRPTTPVMERMAERGIVFESAMATAPWTLPSHASMFTGRWSHQLSTDWTGTLDDTHRTLAETLRDRGYATAGFVANLVFTTRSTGLDRGFDHYEDFTPGVGEAVLSTALGRAVATNSWIRNTLQIHPVINRKVASEVSGDFLAWLDRADRRPFFAFLNYFDAHEPYLPPRRHADVFRSAPRISRGPYLHHLNHALHADWWSLSAAQVAQERDLYDASIASLDEELGDLVEALDARGVLRNTVVIVTSDHGEQFGEHNLFLHGNSLYLPLLHVPLWILAPNTRTTLRVRDSVSLRDIPATVLDLAGVTDDDAVFPGSSLARFWTPGRQGLLTSTLHASLVPAPGQTQPTPSARGPMRSIIEDPYHYILNGDGAEELYDYRTDPGELRNLVGSAAAEAVLPRFRKLLDG
jgi:arylsulfatase A-like enzyme